MQLAELAEKEPEKLKKAGLRDEDLTAIAELAEKVRSDDLEAVQAVVDGHQGAFNAVRKELVSELTTAGGMGSWAERVKKSKEVHLSPADTHKEPRSKKRAENFEAEASDRVEPKEEMVSATAREHKRRGKEPSGDELGFSA